MNLTSDYHYRFFVNAVLNSKLNIILRSLTFFLFPFALIVITPYPRDYFSSLLFIEPLLLRQKPS